MKRNSLTTAVVAGIAGVAGFAGLANAVDLNPDGLGQVLIYPYYTVNKSQATLFSVVNTDPVNGKGVKVRFLEGYNSREVLDFNLYLSPNDVWTATVTQSGDESSAAQVNTTDQSCTDPSVLDNGPVLFRAAAYDGSAGDPPGQDDGPQGVDRTREGYIELISMGDIDPSSDLAGLITHIDGVPPGCSSISDPVAQAGLVAPTGGLFGEADIVNVGEGTLFAYTADAIDGFSAVPLYSGGSNLAPTLQQANSAEATQGVARAYVFTNGGQLVTADYAFGEDAVSAVYMSDAIYNTYIVSPQLGANTDWIVTFPTKRFYVDPLYVGDTAVPPFVETFHAPGESNVVVVPSIYDREENTTTVQGDFSPPISSTPNALPFEVNVISFLAQTSAGDPSGVLGSFLRPNIQPFAQYGWLKLDLTSGDTPAHQLPGGVTPAGVPVTLNGLPATGYMAYNVINTEAQPGMLANYGGLFRHRASRSCVGADPACS
jgi:hypothetical protein